MRLMPVEAATDYRRDGQSCAALMHCSQAKVNGRGYGCRLQRWSSAISSQSRPCKVPSPSSKNHASRNYSRSWVIRQKPSPGGYSGPD